VYIMSAYHRQWTRQCSTRYPYICGLRWHGCVSVFYWKSFSRWKDGSWPSSDWSHDIDMPEE
jgi:hypothetical protein